MENNNTIDTTKDQTSALLTMTLKRIREEHLAIEQGEIISDYNNACSEMQNCRESIKQIIDSNRGGKDGIHGFIGERAQVHISNADALINGDPAVYRLLDDNGPIDYLRDSVPIQQKACQSDGRLGLEHVLTHSEKYPFFSKKGGIYQIPRDFYLKYNKFRNMSPEIAGKLRREEYRLWKFIQQYSNDNPDIKIEPMKVNYNEIQSGNIEKTLDQVSKHHKKVKEQRIKKAIQENKPCAKEFTQVCLCSAGIEFIADAMLTTTEKIRIGKSIRDFDLEDYKDIGKHALKGAGKGAVRGAVVYVATNFTPVPASVATAGVTASFGLSSQVIKHKKGEISKEECIHNSIWCVADVAVSAASSMLGGRYISRLFPAQFKGAGIVGTIIGNAVGTIIYGIIKRNTLEKKNNATCRARQKQ